ncbi:MAG TPA: ATP-binding protein [Methanosarcinaceae archaeon]|nr:ATP-binding protein [Methanosarcinaceae archaeon]
MVRFFNREHDLSILEDIYASPSSSLIVLYGRRRVGKTELSKEFLKNKKSIYLFIETKPEKLLLEDLETSLEKVIGVKPGLDDWDDFFNQIFNIPEKIVIVFDEFQNFTKVNPDFFSKFQKYWDVHHRETKHMFIVVGSYVGMMKKIFQGSKEPMFGRATLLFNLKPFTFADSFKFLNGFLDISVEEAMKTYFMLGGVPKYLLLAGEFGTPDAMETFNKLFPNTRMLMEEAKNILVLEFGSEHKGYFSILEAISSGRAIPSEIADYTGIAANTVSKYLHELLYDYEMIKKEKPIISARARSSRYLLNDNFFNFWFRFIYKNYGTFEIDPQMGVELVKKDINAYFGLAFEGVAKELLIDLNKKGAIPFRFLNIGRWWDKDTEIDLIAFDDKNRDAIFCEVKWKHLTRQEAEHIIKGLKDKAEKVKGNWNEHYCLIAKKIEGKEQLDFLAFDLEDIGLEVGKP